MSIMAVAFPHTASAPSPTPAPASPQRFLACTVALMGSFIGYWLLNYSAFPLFDPVYLWTREASAVVGGITLTALAFASYWHPRLFASRRFLAATVSTMVVGSLVMTAGIFAPLPAVLVCGAALVTVGTGLANIIVGIGCIGLDMRRLGISVTLAYVLAYALRGAFALLPWGVNLALFCIIPLLTVLIMAPYARPLFNQVYAEGSPAQAAVTAPSSFLPFGHQLFITLLLFRFIYGYTLTFGEVGRVPLLALEALVPLGLVLAYVVLNRKDFSPDAFFQLSILCSVAGFLMVSIVTANGSLVSTLLSCGTGFFEILMYFVLIALGAKNTVSALPLFAWGSAMASWGTLLGANFGRFTNAMAADATMASIISACIVFGIVAYVVLVQKSFSFSQTIQGITPLAPLVSAHAADANADADSPLSPVADRCAAIGKAAGLTDREQEIFEYLARGRNVRFIQDELTVSYNTVKTHVSHIYAKLDVHSHQELIDLVERPS